MSGSQFLHYHTVVASGGSPRKWLLMLHGLLGAGRNWAQVARQLVERREDWAVALVDLRGHGRSTGLPGPHDLSSAADDLHTLAERLEGPPASVLGHSFGGKVALRWAGGQDRSASGGPPQQVWVVDSTPGPRPAGGEGALPTEDRGGGSEAWRLVRLLHRLPNAFASRNRAVAALEEGGVRGPVARWVASNLYRGSDGVYRWRFELDVIDNLMRDYTAADLWPVVERPPAGLEIHIIKAGGSDLLGGEACERIERAARRTGRVHLHRVAGGHWLNVDHPEAVVALLCEYL